MQLQTNRVQPLGNNLQNQARISKDHLRLRVEEVQQMME